MENLLSVNSICKTYGQTKVVNNLSFEVKPGEIMSLLGPNGAGKTTTIRMIMGITAPDDGNVHFNTGGRELDVIPKSKVGYLPEERGLYKEARVMDVLLFLSGLKGVSAKAARKTALNWLEKFGLDKNAYSKVEQLSKGMAQKVQFIAACIHEPQLLVLDEPFSGLDPVSQDLFKAEIRALAERGTAILLSSHQMSIVEEMCDRIFLLHKGAKVLYGTLDEIKAHYGAYRVTLHTGMDAWIEQLANNPSVDTSNRSGSVWNLVLKEHVRPADFLAILPKDAPIEEMSISRISLHDIFVRIAQGGDRS